MSSYSSNCGCRKSPRDSPVTLTKGNLNFQIALLFSSLVFHERFFRQRRRKPVATLLPTKRHPLFVYCSYACLTELQIRPDPLLQL